MEDVQPTRQNTITPIKEGDESLNMGIEGRILRSHSYSVLELPAMEQMQREMIDTVSSKLAITSSSAGVMLRSHRWNERALLDAYDKDPAEVCKKAGVASSLHTLMRSSSTGEAAQMFECPVCFDDVPMSKSFAMNCNHRQCVECWVRFLECEIESGTSSGGSCLTTTCPGLCDGNKGCKESVGEELFEMLLPPETFEKYQRKLQLSFVDDNDNIQWCPAIGCGRAVAFSKRRKSVG
jgi:ariadne-1